MLNTSHMNILHQSSYIVDEYFSDSKVFFLSTIELSVSTEEKQKWYRNYLTNKMYTIFKIYTKILLNFFLYWKKNVFLTI